MAGERLRTSDDPQPRYPIFHWVVGLTLIAAFLGGIMWGIAIGIAIS